MFSQEDGLKEHFKEIHGKDMTLQCEVCHKSFKGRQSLLGHQKKDRCKPNSGSKLYQYDCEVCESTFSR